LPALKNNNCPSAPKGLITLISEMIMRNKAKPRRRGAKPYTRGELNKLIDILCHPLFQENPGFILIARLITQAEMGILAALTPNSRFMPAHRELRPTTTIHDRRCPAYLTMLRALHAARKTDIQLIQHYLGKRLEPLTNPIGSFLLAKNNKLPFSKKNS